MALQLHACIREEIIKSIRRLFSILGLLLLTSSTLSAQDSISQKHYSVNGYLKDMQTFVFFNTTEKWETMNLIHNRINFKWFPITPLSVTAEMRNRFMIGNLLKENETYKLGQVADAGLIKLNTNVIIGRSYLLNVAIDRFYIDYNKNRWQLTLGRQRINWGQTFVWNPNDLFNSYNYFDFDYEEKPGSDAARIQYYTTSTNRAELAMKADSARKITTAGLYRFNKWDYDFQLLAGILGGEDIVLGAGWSGQVAKGGFRGEMSYFRPRKNFNQVNGHYVASIGYDYMFANSLFLQLECLYSSTLEGVKGFDITHLNSFQVSVKNPFFDNVSIFTSLSYPFTPLWKGSLGTIANPHNKIYIAVPSFDLNLLQNLDFSLISQIMGMENSQKDFTILTLILLRLKYSF
jgi:hypothetical protein